MKNEPWYKVLNEYKYWALGPFSSITLSYVHAVQSSFFCFRHQICHNALLTLHFSSFAGNDITDRKVSQSLLQNQNSPSITVHGRFMVSRNTTKNQRVIRRESKTVSYSKGPTLFGLHCILCHNF